MTSHFIQTLLNNEDILCGEAFPSPKLRLYRLSLKNEAIAALPDDYWGFFTQVNGLIYNDAQLYAINPEAKTFKDLLSVNQNAEDDGIVILGENELDFLVYNLDDEEYQILDKADAALWKHSDDFIKVLSFLLKL